VCEIGVRVAETQRVFNGHKLAEVTGHGQGRSAAVSAGREAPIL